MNKVGVTGAAGFIGSHLCDRLLSEGIEVVAVDDLSMGTLENIESCLPNPAFRFVQMDCTQRRELRAAFRGCDTIVHLAAQKIPRYGGALMTLESNVAGVNSAAEVALSMDAVLIMASTSDVYGNAPLPFREDGPLMLGAPTSRRWAYAVSKLYDEHMLMAMAEEHGLQHTILRFFGSYGPRNHPSWWGGPQSAFIERLLDDELIDIHGDGLQTRTFTFVTDTVDGIYRAMGTPEARGEIINLGGTTPCTILELAELVHAALDIAPPLRASFMPYAALPGNYEDVRHRVPDVGKARELLGFEASVPLEDGLRMTVEWHRARRAALPQEAMA